MATDGPDPTPCDPEVYENGEHIFTTHSIPSNAMERWVRRVAERSGQRVDWHFHGGRAVVLVLGDVDKAKAAILDLMPEHDELRRQAIDKIEGSTRSR